MSLFWDRCLKPVLSLINPETGYFFHYFSVHSLSTVNFSIFTIFFATEPTIAFGAVHAEI